MDRNARESERRASLGDHHAEVEQLLARVRVGELTREQLELAAFLRHPASCSALGRSSAPVVDGAVDAYCENLLTWGKKVCVRVLYELAHESLPVFEAAHEGRLPRQAVELVAAWLDDPDADRWQGLRDAGHYTMGGRSAEPRGVSAWPGRLACAAAYAAAESDPPGLVHHLGPSLRLLDRSEGAPSWRLVLAGAVSDWVLNCGVPGRGGVGGTTLMACERPRTPTPFERLGELPEPYALALSDRQHALIEYTHTYGVLRHRDSLELFQLSEKAAVAMFAPLLEREILQAEGAGKSRRYALHPEFAPRLEAFLEALTEPLPRSFSP